MGRYEWLALEQLYCITPSLWYISNPNVKIVSARRIDDTIDSVYDHANNPNSPSIRFEFDLNDNFIIFANFC